MMNFFIIFIVGLSSSNILAAPIADANLLPSVDWTFQSTNFKATNFVYTPFFISGDEFISFSAGHGAAAGNGFYRIVSSLSGSKPLIQTQVIFTGPDPTHYNYFRAARIAKNGAELWMVVELSGCYSGCSNSNFPNRWGAYRSLDNGIHWSFLSFVSVDGDLYTAQWFGHTGLVFNPSGRSTLDLVTPSNNRFITVGENRNILVSADGINFRSIAMNHPFPKDRLVFAALVKTPYGFHLTSCSNWSETYYTTTVRHLFSKDLINWVPIESNSILKHPTFYKGVHLSYDEGSKKLWALSPSGSIDGLSFLAWLTPKDFLDPKQKNPATSWFDIGEYVHVKGQTAMITHRSGEYYNLRLFNGTYLSGYKKEQLVRPLSGYNREGCVANDNANLCVGDTVYFKENLATIVGYFQLNSNEIKYAIKFMNGSVDTGYLRSMLTIP